MIAKASEAVSASMNGSAPQIDASDLLGFSADDYGNAQSCEFLYKDKILFTNEFGWLYFTGTHWESKQSESVVNQAIVATFEARQKAALEHVSSKAADDSEEAKRFEDVRTSILKSTVKSTRNKNNVRSMLKDLLSVGIDRFDKGSNLLNCINGVVNLRDGRLSKHDPSQHFTYCIPVAYDENAKSELWQECLNQWISDEETREFLRLAAGYSLTGENNEEVMFYLYGKTRSGKGTFTATMLSLLGYPLATGADFSTFTASRIGDTQNFDLAGLRPCRFVAASESKSNQRLNEAKIKQVTGNDPVRCAFKGKNLFSYTPLFKIWLSSNFPVAMNVDDTAAWGRVLVIEFMNSYKGKENKNLKKQLANPIELRGVLAWAVSGAIDWYNSERGLVSPDAVNKAVKQARDSIDYITQYIDENYERDSDSFISSQVLYDGYKAWADESGHPVKQKNNFIKSINTRGFTSARKYVMGKQKRVVMGLKERSIAELG